MNHLHEIEKILTQQERQINEYVEMYSEISKLFPQIIKTLEYGLKNESELKAAAEKAIELSKTGYQMKSTDFSLWSKNRSS